MASPRFYCPDALAPGRTLALPDNAAHHAARVLRLQPGDMLTLFNGDGSDYAGRILSIGKHAVEAEITAACTPARESPLAVTLAQGISSGERMDYTLQKAVELGIARIQPLALERSVVKLAGERAEKRTQHWQNVVIAACEQCGRARVPQVLPPLTLAQWLAAPHDDALRLMLQPDSDTRLRDLPAPSGAICLLIGCEGGFSPQEQAAARHAGFLGATLGPRILRTETAALAALAALQTLWGDY